MNSVIVNSGKIVAMGSILTKQSATIHPEIGVNLSCFSNCLQDQWEAILGEEEGLSDFCIEQCFGCVVGDLPGCAFCVGCAAAYVAPCVGLCWSWW